MVGVINDHFCYTDFIPFQTSTSLLLPTPSKNVRTSEFAESTSLEDIRTLELADSTSLEDSRTSLEDSRTSLEDSRTSLEDSRTSLEDSRTSLVTFRISQPNTAKFQYTTRVLPIEACFIFSKKTAHDHNRRPSFKINKI